MYPQKLNAPLPYTRGIEVIEWLIEQIKCSNSSICLEVFIHPFHPPISPLLPPSISPFLSHCLPRYSVFSS